MAQITMETATTVSGAASSAARPSWISRVFDTIARARYASELANLSDAELAKRGVKRSEIFDRAFGGAAK